MNIIDLFSPSAGERLQAATASGPFKTSEAFARVARDIAGDPGETGMTRDHIAAIIMLVTFESDGNLQAAATMVAALDEILRAASKDVPLEPDAWGTPLWSYARAFAEQWLRAELRIEPGEDVPEIDFSEEADGSWAFSVKTRELPDGCEDTTSYIRIESGEVRVQWEGTSWASDGGSTPSVSIMTDPENTQVRPFVLEFEANVDNIGEPGEKDRWRLVVEGTSIQVERWADPDAMGTKHWASFRGDGWNEAAILRYAVTALVRGVEGAREVAARSFVDTSIPKTETETETEAYILAEDLRAGDALVHEGQTMIIGRVAASESGGPGTGMVSRRGIQVYGGPAFKRGQTVSILRRPEPAKTVGAAITNEAARTSAAPPLFAFEGSRPAKRTMRQAPEVVTVNRKAISLQFPAATPASVQAVLFDIADVLELISSTAWAIEDLPAEVAAAKAGLS